MSYTKRLRLSFVPKQFTLSTVVLTLNPTDNDISCVDARITCVAITVLCLIKVQPSQTPHAMRATITPTPANCKITATTVNTCHTS